MILSKSGEIAPNLHLVDLKMFGAPRFCTGFALLTPEALVLMDCGTSNEVQNVLTYLREHGIPWGDGRDILLVPSHHHFDHAGGMWRLYRRIRKRTARVAVHTTEAVQALLQDSDEHMARARSTFGNFVGEMKPLPREAFHIHPHGASIEIPGEAGLRLQLISTPGHTPDHLSPTILQNGKPIFSFLGEACGTLYNTREILTLSTSMPPHFHWDEYMDSIAKLRALTAPRIGYCHFGAIQGTSEVAIAIQEHIQFMKDFRNRVKIAYEERPETRYIVDQIHPWFASRTSWSSNGIDQELMQTFQRMSLALVYGMLQDLGFR